MSRILLVEDDDGLRHIAQLTLQTLGRHEVHACADGQQAVLQAAAFAPDLLLLDVSMPVMDGPTVLRELRKQPALATVPAVFLTANTQADQVSGYRDLGAIDVIAKPFDPRQLTDRIAAALAQGAPAVPASGRRAALVVEDDPGIRYLIRFILEQRGWQVVEARDGTQGMQAISQGPVMQAVILDIMLPGVDGLALLDNLRRSPGWESVPVMMLTGKGDEASVRSALSAGASDYLGKPFDPADLADRLTRLTASAVTSSPSRAA